MYRRFDPPYCSIASHHCYTSLGRWHGVGLTYIACHGRFLDRSHDCVGSICLRESAGRRLGDCNVAIINRDSFWHRLTQQCSTWVDRYLESHGQSVLASHMVDWVEQLQFNINAEPELREFTFNFETDPARHVQRMKIVLKGPVVDTEIRMIIYPHFSMPRIRYIPPDSTIVVPRLQRMGIVTTRLTRERMKYQPRPLTSLAANAWAKHNTELFTDPPAALPTRIQRILKERLLLHRQCTVPQKIDLIPPFNIRPTY